MENRISIPPMQDEHFFNIGHIPLWINMPDDYNWRNKGDGGRQVATGGAEKYFLAVTFYY